MEGPLLVALGLYTASSFFDARVEHLRAHSFSIHKQLLEDWDNITVVAKVALLFVSTTYISCLVLGVPLVYGICSAIFCNFASLYLSDRIAKVNSYINAFFYPSPDLLKDIECGPGLKIQWADSPAKLDRQHLLLIQIIVNVTCAFFSPFPVVFALNALANVYAYDQNIPIMDIKTTLHLHIPIISLLPNKIPAISFHNVEIKQTLTCTPPSAPPDHDCPICFEPSPDTQICQNNHIFHATCIVKTMLLHKPNFRNNSRSTQEIDRASLLTCPLCRDPLPFMSFRMYANDQPVPMLSS